jgi:NADPH oxidase 1
MTVGVCRRPRQNIWYQQRKGKLGALRRVQFIWINRDTGSFSWFSSLLKSLEEAQMDPSTSRPSDSSYSVVDKRYWAPDFLRISTFLTQQLDEDQIYNIALNDGASPSCLSSVGCPFDAQCQPTHAVGNDFDALTSLRSRTQFGRPDFAQIFGALRTAIETGRFLPGREASLSTNVGVFFCGPSPVARDLKAKVQAASTMSVKFCTFPRRAWPE